MTGIQIAILVAVGLLIAFMLALLVWGPASTRDADTVTKADGKAKEPDQVELPDHRIVDRKLAQVIGSSAWAESVRTQYRSKDYDGKIHCLICRREILPGQWFWDTALLSKQTRLPLGVSFQNCLSCQPGDMEANTRGQ